MPQVIIRYKGKAHEVQVPQGMSVLIGASLAGLDELGFGDCGGNLVCATCHVRVNSGTFAPMKVDEQMMLDTLTQIYPNSRLGCQLRVTDACDVDWMGGR